MKRSTSTAGPAKRITARRKNKNAVALKPGAKRDVGSFINIENPEGTIAAYCGFNDIGKFRQFYIGPLVMPYYLKSLAYTGYRRRNVLALLDECPYDRFWADDKDPEQVYPPSSHDSNYRMALIIWQMLRGLRQGLSDDAPAVDATQFQRLTSCMLPSGPALDPEDVPSFGPFAGETDLEPLNRCLCLFSHIKYTTSKSQWEKRFQGKTQWHASIGISMEYQPDWMRQTQSSVAMEAPDEYTGPALEDVPFSIQVTWRDHVKNKKNMAFVNEKKEEGLFAEIPRSITVMITRDMTPSDVRDRIRQGFQLEKYEGNLEVLILEDENDGISALQPDWEVVRKAMLECSCMPTFWCLFRLLDDGEVLWEYSGPPLPLKNFVENKEEDVVAKHNYTPDHIEQVQQRIFQLTVPNVETSFNPLVLFGNDKERMKKAYNGYDVSDPKERRAWQLKHLPLLSHAQLIREIEDHKLKSFRKFSPEQQNALMGAVRDGSMQTVDMESAQDDGQAEEDEEEMQSARDRYYAFQTTLGGNTASAGPPIMTAASALEMKQEMENGQECYTYSAFDSKTEVTRKAKPYQVNGAAWGISTLRGEIPFRPQASEEVKHAVNELRRLRVPGILIADQTGLGKTVLALMILLGFGGPCEEVNGKDIYKPIFLAAPQNLIRQWAREILYEWPIFDLVISYDDGNMDKSLAQHVIPSSAVRAWPDRKLWPEKFSYMFNQHDPRNARTIFLTTPETHTERSLAKETVEHPPTSFDPPKFQKDGKERYMYPAWTEKRYLSRFRNVFSVAVVDEATKIKSTRSLRHLAIKKLKANYWIFMTATPMINRGTCILGPMSIIWENAKKQFDNAAKDICDWLDKASTWRAAFKNACELGPEDVRRLALLNPSFAKALLQCNDHTVIADYFPLIEELFVLRRTTASRIPYDNDRTRFYNIRDLIKPHHMLTWSIERLVEEEAEFQWLHRDAARRLLLARAVPSKETSVIIEKEAPTDLKEDRAALGVAEMRELTIITGSTQAAKFNRICMELDSNTLVSALDLHRLHGWTAFDVVKFICKATHQMPPTTVLDYVKFMMNGSPMLRGLIHRVEEHIAKGLPGKILITEDIPLLAWWWDLTLNLIGFKTATYHSALTAGERDALMLRFNDPGSDLRAMVLPYDVGALGINAQGDCSSVVVMSAAKNQGMETQAIFRPVRVNSPREVTIIKMFIPNSICGFRESMKTDKYVIELATRAKDPVVRSLAVELLNEYQKEVQAAQDDPANAELMRQLRELQVELEEDLRAREEDLQAREEAQDGAITVAERDPELDLDNIIRSRRAKKVPERYNNIEWDDNGNRIKSLSEKERQDREDLIGEDSEDEDLPHRKPFPSKRSKHVSEDEEDTSDEEDISDEEMKNFLSESDSDDGSDSYESEPEPSDEEESEEEFEEESEEKSSEAPMTEKQRAKLKLRLAQQAEPIVTEQQRQLSAKLLADYDKVWTEEDLDHDPDLNRALRLIHAKKVGLPLDNVPSVHIKYNRFTKEMLENIEKKEQVVQDQARPMLLHLLAGKREEDFKPSKGKGKKRPSSGSEKQASAKKKTGAQSGKKSSK